MKYTIEEFDKVKTRVLKYVMYKKRTKSQVYMKFKSEIDEDLLEDVIADLEENGYISDTSFVKKSVNEYMALKNLSIKELKYKLMQNGISSSLVDDYFSSNIEELEEYEQRSAENIAIKRSVNMDEFEIKNYLIKKGYKQENIENAISKIEE
jgi:SOS response regulatory protein OraA/RecX